MGSPFKVQNFSPNLGVTIFHQIWGKFSGAYIFGLIWPNISGAFIFLKMLGHFLLIYPVNPYYFCRIHTKKHVFGALIFGQILRFENGGIYFSPNLRNFGGGLLF